MGVSASWRPQPCSRSTAAPAEIAVVAVTAPYTAMDTITYAETLPPGRRASDQPCTAPNRMNSTAGSRATNTRLGIARTFRRTSWAV